MVGSMKSLDKERDEQRGSTLLHTLHSLLEMGFGDRIDQRKTKIGTEYK